MKKIVLIIVSLLLLVSCSSIKDDSNDTKTDISTSIMDTATKDKVLDICSRFAEYQYLDNQDKNTAISPLSAYFVLAMLSAIENGDTLAEMETMLNMKINEIEKITLLYPEYKKYFYGNELQESEDGKLIRNTEGAMLLSNSMWKGSQFSLDVNKATKLMDAYQSEIYNISDDKALNFNSIFQEYIKRNMNEFSMDIDIYNMEPTKAVFMNLLYLKDIWNLPLKESNDFYDFYGDSINRMKLLLGNYESGLAYETNIYKTFYLDTKNGFRLSFIVPKENNNLSDVVTQKVIKEVCQLKYNGKDTVNKINNLTRCIFPAFEIQQAKDLNPILMKYFGLQKLFDNDTYSVGSFRQYIKLNVDKLGIEGGAVTIAENFGSANNLGYKNEYYDFVVDRSFAFIISDSNQIPLFTGVIQSV